MISSGVNVTIIVAEYDKYQTGSFLIQLSCGFEQ